MKIADGLTRDPFAAPRTPPVRRHGLDLAPKALALLVIRERRTSSRSNATAQHPVPLRHHSIAILPEPAPTSHSSSPGRGASAVRVTARINCLVSWPSCAKASSGRNVQHPVVGQVPHGDHVERVDPSGRCPAIRAVPSRRRSAGPPSCSRIVDSDSPRPVSFSNRASFRGLDTVAAQHDRPSAAAHRGIRLGGHQADHLGVLHRPAQPGARQRHRRHMREHRHPLGAEQPDQGCADAVQHRVTGGDDVDVAAGSSRTSRSPASSGDGHVRRCASRCRRAGRAGAETVNHSGPG